MRELITRVSCDVCKADDTLTPADETIEIRVIIDGRPHRLDVCAEHKNPTWQDIVMFAWPDINATPKAPAVRPSLACPECGQRVASNPHGLGVHMAKVHGNIPLAERQRAAGLRVTDRNANRRRGGGEVTTCPVCSREAASPHGVVMHMVTAHPGIDKAERNRLIAEASA